MVEEQVGFLIKIASSLSQSNCISNSLLQSYYLLQCKDITGGFGLPDKQFSPKVRCSHCCLEWRNGTSRKMQVTKLSKNQKRRIKLLKDKNDSFKKNVYVGSRKALLSSKELVQICTFCNKKTVVSTPKLKRDIEDNADDTIVNKHTENITQSVTSNKKREKITTNKNISDKNNILSNIYSDSRSVFSLTNKNNILQSSIKATPKVISNNKKKKEKFAGLCQKAVMEVAKLKEEKLKQNKINLFLKPST